MTSWVKEEVHAVFAGHAMSLGGIKLSHKGSDGVLLSSFPYTGCEGLP